MSNVKSFKRTHTADRVLDAIQDNVQIVFKQLTDNPLTSAKLIPNIKLVAGQDTLINCGLSQPLQGWILIGKSAKADVWDKQSTNTLSKTTLILTADTDVIVSIIVF